MSRSSSKIRELEPLLRYLFSAFARLTISARVAVADAKFMRRQMLPQTGISRTIAAAALAGERCREIAREEAQGAIYKHFSQLLLAHYGSEGRGYRSVAAESHDVRLGRYQGQRSRLEFFIKGFPDLIQYKDGDSFLDFGCGTGQNIRTLAERFPSSRIVGYDLNESAIELIEECEIHAGVSVAVGDLTDDSFRQGALEEGFDHIILSHVFSLIFDSTRIETWEARKRILSSLLSACRSSLIIVDTFGGQGELKVSIEQRQRAIVSDDVLGLVSSMDGGRAFMVASDRTRAVVFRRDKTGAQVVSGGSTSSSELKLLT